LKQDQYAPLPVEKQILVIYAGNRGFLDEFEVGVIKEYEKRLYEYFDERHRDLLQQIAEKREIGVKLDESIASALKEFNLKFKEEIKK
jgi:F-type H+-transporting ATPase subunit alpha